MENLDFIKSVLSLHDEMERNGFSLVYEGEFNHDIMKMFTSMAEKDMDKLNEERSVKRKVFHVMVECLQNMTKHSDEYSEDFVLVKFQVVNDDIRINEISGTQPELKEQIMEELCKIHVDSEYEDGQVYMIKFTFDQQ